MKRFILLSMMTSTLISGVLASQTATDADKQSAIEKVKIWEALTKLTTQIGALQKSVAALKTKSTAPGDTPIGSPQTAEPLGAGEVGPIK